MNPVTDPAKKSHEAKGVDKKKESHAPAVKDDKAPEPKPASNADDRLTPEEVERDYQFFDVGKVPDSFFALAVAPRLGRAHSWVSCALDSKRSFSRSQKNKTRL